MIYLTYTWDLAGTLESASVPPGRHQPHLLIPSAQTIDQKKANNPEMRFNSQQIVSYCLGLRTQNPELREVDLELSPHPVSTYFEYDCLNFWLTLSLFTKNLGIKAKALEYSKALPAEKSLWKYLLENADN